MPSSAEKQATIARLYEASVDRRRKQRDGVIVTPIEVVDFNVMSAITSLARQGYAPDEVEWLDPFGGTGIFLARLLQIVALPPERKAKVASNCIMLEIDPHAAQVAADNLAYVYREETGLIGSIRVLCLDTFSLSPDADLWDHDLNKYLVAPCPP